MPKISSGSVTEHRQRIRRRVLEAFSELMAERSYDAITMAALAEHAGVGRTAIYHYFPDKESVVVAFASDETEKYLHELQEILQGVLAPPQRLRLYLEQQLTAGERFHMGLGGSLVGHLSTPSRLAIRDHVVAVENVLREILQAGIDGGDFHIDDLPATMSLIHACLNPRHLPTGAVQEFVLRAVSR